MNQNVRKITEGAMMVALIGVFMLIDRQFQGTFSSTFAFLLPLPMDILELSMDCVIA